MKEENTEQFIQVLKSWRGTPFFFFFPFWVGVRVEAFDIPKRLDVRSCYLWMYLEV